jgi:hypothetical protein
MSIETSFFQNHKKKIITCIILGAVAWGSSYILGPDNKVEQAAEALIKDQTGLEVDVSPQK